MSDDRNPHRDTTINPTLRVTISADWIDNSQQQRRIRIDAIRERELAAFFASLLAADDDAELDVTPALLARLQEFGILVAEASAPAPLFLESKIPDRLPALLPLEHPDFSSGAERDEKLVLNECCYLQDCDLLPKTIESRLPILPPLRVQQPLVWIDDPASRSLSVYELDSVAGRFARALLDGEHASEEVPTTIRQVLALARVLVPPNYAVARKHEWNANLVRAKAQWSEHGFALLPRVLDPIATAGYRDYVRQLANTERLRSDSAYPGRRTAYRDRLCEFLHTQLIHTVESVLEQPILASYSYFCEYLPGAVLERHRDRPQCKWNISLVLDADPETPRTAAWPLFIETDEVHEVRLAPGDAVLYSGTDHWHWRDAQPTGCRTRIAFLHFVPKDFIARLD